jgi:hypothetical protein
VIGLVFDVLFEWFVFLAGFLVGCFWAGRRRDEIDSGLRAEIDSPTRLRVVHSGVNGKAGDVRLQSAANDVGPAA